MALVISASAWTANGNPTLVSVSPQSGTGLAQTFTLTYSDANGAADIAWTSVLIDTSADGVGSCWATYEPGANRIWLVKDNSLNWIYGTPGSSATLQNAQCSIDLKSSSASAQGSNLTLTLAVTFTSIFSGQKTVYMRAVDQSGGLADYAAMGSWTVAGGPIYASMSPNQGQGLAQTFTFNFVDANGAASLRFANIVVPSAGSVGACWIGYQPAYRAVSLVSDNESTWSYGTVGSATTLSNSQCSIDLGNSSATSSGSTVTLTLPMTFAAGFSGYKTFYSRLWDFSGAFADSTAIGTWGVLAPAPAVSAATAPAPPLVTGVHWASPADLPELSSKLGYGFAVMMFDPGDVAGRRVALAQAQALSLKLIVGAYPPPYSLQPDGSWKISADGIGFLNDLASYSSVVQAVFVFNEPYWIDPATGATNPCGAISADQLRSLRATIQSVWPGARTYVDLGDPQGWAPGGDGYKTCMGTKYQDQSGVADYVGIWNYPFKNGGYNRQTGLDFAYNASRYVENSMKATPVFLGQTFACTNSNCENEGLTMPTASQIQDWNCSLRTVLAPGSLLSWYVWRQTPLYSDFLANHPELWSLTTAAACPATP